MHIATSAQGFIALGKPDSSLPGTYKRCLFITAALSNIHDLLSPPCLLSKYEESC